jgi:hypothetical protein
VAIWRGWGALRFVDEGSSVYRLKGGSELITGQRG